jgi:signal transduction histidine kinase
MKGVPNLGVIASQSFGEAFMRMHNDRANSPLRHGDVDIPKSKLVDLKNLSETINQDDYFTTNQKQSINQLIAENLNNTEFLRLVPGQQLS